MARQRHEPRRSTGGKAGRWQFSRPYMRKWKSTLDRTAFLAHELSLQQANSTRLSRSSKTSERGEVARSATMRKRQWRERGNFEFLKLPRELRDMVYGYYFEVGQKMGKEKVYHSIRTQARYEASERYLPLTSASAPNATTCPFLVNRQIHTEAKESVYKSSTFAVHLDVQTPVFTSRTSVLSYDPHHAIPSAWDIKLIISLVIRIDLGGGHLTKETMHSLRWPALRQMQCLKRVRIVVTMCRVREYDDVASFVDRWGSEPEGTLEFRGMMERMVEGLPGSVRSVVFGAGEGGLKELVRDETDEEVEESTTQVGGEWMRDVVVRLKEWTEFENRVGNDGDGSGKLKVDAVGNDSNG